MGDTGGDPVEWVDLGETSQAASTESIEGGAREPWRPRPVHLVAAAVVAALIVVAVAWPRGSTEPPGAGRPTSTTAPSSATSPSSTPPAQPTRTVAQPQPVLTQVAPRILGVSAGWELFGRGAGVVARVELAAGRVTTTEVPSLLSSGPVWFVVGRDRALVRPLDAVTGYVVGDGAATAPLGGALQAANVVLPGPDPDHIWRQVGDNNPPEMALASLDGTVVGQRVGVPFGVTTPLASDGSGYLLFLGVGGVYDVRPGAVDRVTTGSLLAVGPGRWVAVECNDSYRCTTVVVDLSTQTRREIGAPLSPNVPIGAVSPDGRAAAIYLQNPNGSASVQLLDLSSGRVRAVRVALDQAFQEQNMVWSPDSSMLFVLDARGRVQVVDPATGSARPLGVSLPPLVQLAIRPAR